MVFRTVHENIWPPGLPRPRGRAYSECSLQCYSCIDATTDRVKKCMEYEVEGSRPRGRPKRTRKEVVQKDCQARNLNKEEAMDRGRWKKLIKIG